MPNRFGRAKPQGHHQNHGKRGRGRPRKFVKRADTEQVDELSVQSDAIQRIELALGMSQSVDNEPPHRRLQRQQIQSNSQPKSNKCLYFSPDDGSIHLIDDETQEKEVNDPMIANFQVPFDGSDAAMLHRDQEPVEQNYACSSRVLNDRKNPPAVTRVELPDNDVVFDKIVHQSHVESVEPEDTPCEVEPFPVPNKVQKDVFVAGNQSHFTLVHGKIEISDEQTSKLYKVKNSRSWASSSMFPKIADCAVVNHGIWRGPEDMREELAKKKVPAHTWHEVSPLPPYLERIQRETRRQQQRNQVRRIIHLPSIHRSRNADFVYINQDNSRSITKIARSAIPVVMPYPASTTAGQYAQSKIELGQLLVNNSTRSRSQPAEKQKNNIVFRGKSQGRENEKVSYNNSHSPIEKWCFVNETPCEPAFLDKELELLESDFEESFFPFRGVPVCLICNKMFDSGEERKLAHHLASHHLKSFIHECVYCPAKFASKRDVVAHCKTEHPGEPLRIGRSLDRESEELIAYAMHCLHVNLEEDGDLIPEMASDLAPYDSNLFQHANMPWDQPTTLTAVTQTPPAYRAFHEADPQSLTSADQSVAYALNTENVFGIQDKNFPKLVDLKHVPAAKNQIFMTIVNDKGTTITYTAPPQEQQEDVNYDFTGFSET